MQKIKFYSFVLSCLLVQSLATPASFASETSICDLITAKENKLTQDLQAYEKQAAALTEILQALDGAKTGAIVSKSVGIPVAVLGTAIGVLGGLLMVIDPRGEGILRRSTIAGNGVNIPALITIAIGSSLAGSMGYWVYVKSEKVEELKVSLAAHKTAVNSLATRITADRKEIADMKRAASCQ